MEMLRHLKSIHAAMAVSGGCTSPSLTWDSAPHHRPTLSTPPQTKSFNTTTDQTAQLFHVKKDCGGVRYIICICSESFGSQIISSPISIQLWWREDKISAIYSFAAWVTNGQCIAMAHSDSQPNFSQNQLSLSLERFFSSVSFR